ncbi:nucleoside phosphorylase [Maritalea sp.]|uniref:nucleoside phosphorylase n=1 Tax=Maritalea sp. TaxID=2003361 RepID=UPI003EF84CD9
MPTQYHIKCRPGDVAECVLLPGDPARVEVIASHWDSAHKVAENREYVTYTGTYKGAPISCMSTGIGCPSTAIGIEELARCGATTFLRVGTCGTFQDHVKVGDLAIFDSAVREDGTSKAYAPVEFPAVASVDVVNACIQAAKSHDVLAHVGTTRSADTFYASHPAPGSSFGGYWQSNWKQRFEDLRRMNVIAAEMEASTIFVLARVWGLRAGGVSVVLDNMMKLGEEADEFDPEAQLDHSAAYINKLAVVGSEAVRILHEAG